MQIKKILILHTGSLGDTLVSVPALWAIREHFPDAHITMLSDLQKGKKYVRPKDVLDGSGLVDDYIFYTVDPSFKGVLIRPLRMLKLLFQLRRLKFDALVYLIRTGRNLFAIKRDVVFFRLAGIKRFIGHKGLRAFPPKEPGKPLPVVPHHTDLFLTRLAISGVSVPPPGHGKTDLKIGTHEIHAVEQWTKTLPSDQGRLWIGIGPGTKNPVNRWPFDSYYKVVDKLIAKYDIWPVVFGGQEDQELGERLVKKWGRGYVAAGRLNPRQGIAALQRCILYLGNDTGTLHMAVAAGIPCVAIFSSRDYPGEWYPYGDGHFIFRTPIDCEGCRLEICIERKMKCIVSIEVDEVFEAIDKILSQKSSHRFG